MHFTHIKKDFSVSVQRKTDLQKTMALLVTFRFRNVTNIVSHNRIYISLSKQNQKVLVGPAICNTFCPLKGFFLLKKILSNISVNLLVTTILFNWRLQRKREEWAFAKHFWGLCIMDLSWPRERCKLLWTLTAYRAPQSWKKVVTAFIPLATKR